ncbi:hypothetical protein D3C80_1547800 [compost metagenome]
MKGARSLNLFSQVDEEVVCLWDFVCLGTLGSVAATFLAFSGTEGFTAVSCCELGLALYVLACAAVCLLNGCCGVLGCHCL